MTTIIRVHFRFTSENGDSFYDYADFDTFAEARDFRQGLINDPQTDDIWTETYDDEEGWQG